MTFPDVLVERVAAAMFEGRSADDGPVVNVWPPANEGDRVWWCERAGYALEAIDMHLQRSHGMGGTVLTRWVAMTDWEWEHDD